MKDGSFAALSNMEHIEEWRSNKKQTFFLKFD